MNKIFRKICQTYVKNTLHPLRDEKGATTSPSGKLERVLFINGTDDVGGAAIMANKLRNSIKADGLEADFLVNKKRCHDPTIHLLRHAVGYTEFKRRITAKITREFNRIYQNYIFPMSMKIPGSDLLNQADVVHLHNQHGGYMSPFVLPPVSAVRPLVWTLHDMQAITGHCAHSMECENWRDGCLECPHLDFYPSIKEDVASEIWRDKKKLYENSRMTVVCPSRWLLEKARQGVMANCDVRLIYNGVDTDIFTPADKNSLRDELDLPRDKTILLFSANQGLSNRYKGGKFILDVYEALGKRDDLLFLNVGNKDGFTDKGPNWHEVGYVKGEENMAKYLAASDLLFYPSLADNCPLTVLESMSCGTPVVSFKTGGIPELIKPGVTGELVDYESSEGFIKTVSRMIDSREKLRSLGFAAREDVEKRFSFAIMKEQYIKLYREVAVGDKD